LEKPVGVDYIWGQKENETEGFGTLGIALLAAILVYLVMVSLYDSFAHPFVVLFVRFRLLEHY
jgi:HAE1 family hydrophobic/amphiphilic exporter-1